MLVMVPSTLGPGVGAPVVSPAPLAAVLPAMIVFSKVTLARPTRMPPPVPSATKRGGLLAVLVDAAVAGLSVIKTQSPMLHIDRGRIVVRNSGAIREAAGAVHAATAVGLSAIAAVTANCEVVGKRRGIELMFHRRHQKKRASALLLRLSRECHLGAPQH